MALSKEDKSKISYELSGIFGSVYLIVDGYAVFVCVKQYGMKLIVLVYVDGFVKGINIPIGIKSEFEEKLTDIAKRFYHVKKKCTLTSQHLKVMAKHYKKKIEDLKDENSIYTAAPDFKSAKLFISHLEKNNQSIELVTKDVYDKFLENKVVTYAAE